MKLLAEWVWFWSVRRFVVVSSVAPVQILVTERVGFRRVQRMSVVSPIAPIQILVTERVGGRGLRRIGVVTEFFLTKIRVAKATRLTDRCSRPHHGLSWHQSVEFLTGLAFSSCRVLGAADL